jgi:hypothetical protein
VIACGKARYVEDEQELRGTLIKFMKYYGKNTFEPSRSSCLETRAIIYGGRDDNSKKRTGNERNRIL